MAGRRRVHHHEAPARLANDPREGLKHGDLFGTGERRSSSSRGAPLGIQARPLGGQHLGTVTLGLGVRIDAAHRQVWQCSCQGLPRWAAGSDVVRCTGNPRLASSTATAAARVVLPTALAHQHR